MLWDCLTRKEPGYTTILMAKNSQTSPIPVIVIRSVGGLSIEIGIPLLLPLLALCKPKQTNMRAYFLLLLLFISCAVLRSQVYFDVDQSVKVTAQASASPPTITVNWIQDPRAISYDLYRREYGAEGWGAKIDSYPAEVTEYVDTEVKNHLLYEYKIEKFVEGVEGYGYVLSGIEVPAVHQSGAVLFVITTTTLAQLMPTLEAYQEVLTREGWRVRQLVVENNWPVSRVKSAIVGAYEESPFSSVLLLGDVPVAYSGDINPDAHQDHKGAWAADIFYGDMDGTWTDTLVNNTTAATPHNHNVPGDEKWDQSFLPSNVEAAVGRVDFSEMPVYEEDEYELLRRYLQKNMDYRTNQFSVRRRAAMRNTNPWIGALGQNGIRNFSPLVSPDSITYDEWQAVFRSSYQWYYGSGGGSQTSAIGLGNSYLYTQGAFQAIFTGWFGSYFGDYDFENNYLRAVLGSGTTLSAVWAGAPHWHFHSMGMGFPLAHATVATQNNDTIYTADFFPRGVHTNLLGDPTLKAYILAPPSDLALTQAVGLVNLNWTPSLTPIDQYYLYRRTSETEAFTLIDSTSSALTTYQDSCQLVGKTYQYLVRAVKLETTPSGSFQNLSVGAMNSIQATINYQAVADFIAEQNGNTIQLTNTSNNAEQISWLFPDGTTSTLLQTTYSLQPEDDPSIQLIASNRCSSDTITQSFISTSNQYLTTPEFLVYPNPVTNTLTIQLTKAGEAIELLTTAGRSILRQPATASLEQTVDVSHLPSGVYLMRVKFSDGVLNKVVRIAH